MTKQHWIMLVSLGAIWGASFMFMRVLAPTFGPVLTASFRLLIGAFVLIIYYRFRHVNIQWNQWKFFSILGAISLGIPYFLFSLAALYIPSGLSAVLNSTSPMFSFLLSMILFSESLEFKKITGLVFGTIGVYVISTDTVQSTSTDALIGILACSMAAFLYAVAGAVIKTKAKHIDSKSLAVGNQLFAGIFLLPFAFVFPMTGTVTFGTVLTLIVFGSFGSGVASIMYFTLMKEVGPLKTLTVTYLLPIFGVFWGYIILNESLNPVFYIGGLLIILGTILVTHQKKAI